MLKTLRLILILCSCLFATCAFPQSHHSGTHSGTHSSKSHTSKNKKSSGNKTVHVNGYYRKDGRYVAPYDRSAPGTASAEPSSERTYYNKNHIAEGYSADPSVQRDSHGKIKRSQAAKSEFERQSPCPSTGKASGKCPGYVVDHINPLECGGADNPSNMQWQTVAEGKAKDKTERSCRH